MRQGKAYWQARAEIHESVIDLLSTEVDTARARIVELERREWQRYQGGDYPAVAMPDPGPDPDVGYEWQHDETGLLTTRVKIPEFAPE